MRRTLKMGAGGRREMGRGLTQTKPKLGAKPVIGGINLFQKASRKIWGGQTMWKQKNEKNRGCKAEKDAELPQRAE